MAEKVLMKEQWLALAIRLAIAPRSQSDKRGYARNAARAHVRRALDEEPELVVTVLKRLLSPAPDPQGTQHDDLAGDVSRSGATGADTTSTVRDTRLVLSDDRPEASPSDHASGSRLSPPSSQLQEIGARWAQMVDEDIRNNPPPLTYTGPARPVFFVRRSIGEPTPVTGAPEAGKTYTRRLADLAPLEDLLSAGDSGPSWLRKKR